MLLGHSLGGIAALDLMVTKRQAREKVELLVTAGSQSGLLYDINAMVSLERGVRFPAPFPKWLNFYDPRDLLAFRAGWLPGSRAIDTQVDNQLPFPQAHSGYWTNPSVWATVRHAWDRRRE